MIPLSAYKLSQKFHFEDERRIFLPGGSIFTYTIYSPTAKKKFKRNLEKFKTNLQDYTKTAGKMDIYFKYLKTLVSRTRLSRLVLFLILIQRN